MTQLGPVTGPSPLETLVETKSSRGKPPLLDKPGPGFADELQRQSERVGPPRQPERDPVRESPKETRLKGKNEPEGRESDGGKTQDSKVKQAAMLKFMDSMESEFGIPPEDLVAAMADLKPTDLLKTPEETAFQVVQKLELAPEDQDRALALYLSFLSETRTAVTPAMASLQDPQLGKGLEGATLPAAGAVTLQRKAEQRSLNQSLDQMSKQFFLQGERGDSSNRGTPLMAQLENEARSELSRDAALRASTLEKLGLSESDLSPTMLDSMKSMESTAGGTFDAIPRGGELESVPVEGLDQDLLVNAEDAISETQGRAEAMPMGKIGKKVSAEDFFFLPEQRLGKLEASSATLKGGELSGREASQELLGSSLGGIAGGSSNGASESGLNAFSSEGQQESSGDSNGSETTAKGEFFPHLQSLREAGPLTAKTLQVSGSTSVNSDQMAHQIADQAKMVVFRGGGEAIVKINPEGLGEVSMKVLVKDGKVNVEMATETAEAKKLLESSLGDLRNSLSSQKLNIDQIKVDVGNQASSDNSQQQRGMDSRPDMNRDQARQMMNQFREEFSGRRDSFVEMPGIRAYQKRTAGPEPLTAAPVASGTSRYQGLGRGQNMSVIA